MHLPKEHRDEPLGALLGMQAAEAMSLSDADRTALELAGATYPASSRLMASRSSSDTTAR